MAKHYVILQRTPTTKRLMPVANVSARWAWDAMGNFIDMLQDESGLTYDVGDGDDANIPKDAVSVAIESPTRELTWWWYRPLTGQ
jgi:hypothetical protein